MNERELDHPNCLKDVFKLLKLFHKSNLVELYRESRKGVDNFIFMDHMMNHRPYRKNY